MTEPQTTSPNPQASFESWREGRVMQGGVPRHDLKGNTGTMRCSASNCSARHGTCFRRRLSAHRAGAAPHSAVAELGVAASRIRDESLTARH